MYIATVVLLNVTMLDPEENLMKDWAMCIVVMLLYAIFMSTWLLLMKRTLKRFTVHKWFYAGITWMTLLTIGDILFLQWVVNLWVIIGMLAIVVIGLLLHRQNANIVDGLMAGVLLLVLYGAMQFNEAILPNGIVGGLLLTLPFIIVGALREWAVTLWLARGLFFSMAAPVLFLMSPWPIFSDYNYLLYILLAFFIVAYFIGRIKPILLPQSWMPWLIGLSILIFALKFTVYLN